MNKSLITSLIVTLGFAFLFFITPVPVNAYSYKTSSFRMSTPRNYTSGGSLYRVNGYVKKSGTYVAPYTRTRPDNTIYNNRKYILGY